ncbi:hypothetical protein LOK49_LG10G02822 [Camellia lanceoleosa]|uniref:Uncharacterized protein n=1 Tax=Camellia lanceoleosa TaxID=1840588 RepID=A0ACC0G7B5_9ERIC|nr:hypothetical protein LOK49_LG10G02822 [Camellia lanceoleosa]
MARKRREQIFIPMSDFGDGWEGVALVLEGFGLHNGGPMQGKEGSRPGPSQSAMWGVTKGVKEVRGVTEVEWFRLLDRSLVGGVGDMGGKGMSFAAMSD